MPDDDVRKKVDRVSRHLLPALPGDRPVDLLIRLESAASESDLDALKRAGCELGDVVGNVLSGRVAGPSRVMAIASLPFVRHIELSKALYQEPAASSPAVRDLDHEREKGKSDEEG
jgi:hypothetical protein